MSPDVALADRVHRRVLDEQPGAGELRRRIAELTRNEAPLLDDAGVADLVDAVAARTIGLGALDAVLADPSVTEIMVNGPGAA
jgi:pilus assembly protein CpaF